MTAERSKIHHYVPRFLLRNFTSGKSPQIWVFDKLTGNRFRSNVKNVAAEKGFYNFFLEGENYTIEPSLADIEDSASKIITKICSNGSLKSLIDEDRGLLANFLALQFVRTKHSRVMVNELMKSTREALLHRGIDPNKIEDIKDFSEDEENLFSISRIYKSNEFAPHFLSKTWTLFKGSKKNPFYLGDSPIALYNANDFRPYGNLGLMVKGIQIYLPLSSYFTIGLFCPSIELELRQRHYLIYSQAISKNGNTTSITQDPQRLESLINGINSGDAIQLNSKNILFNNSLQVSFSERFVFSSNEDFSLLEKMLHEHPELKKGPRWEVD